MFNTWVKKITGQLPNITSHEAGRQGAQSFERRKNKREQLIDITEASSFAEEARKQSMALMNRLRKSGGSRPTVPTWNKTKKTVSENLAAPFDFEDLVDEITEKLEDASEQDPFFQKLIKKL